MPKIRIVAEVLVVIALALGIWMVLRPKDPGPSTAKATGPDAEQVDEDGGPRLLRGTAKKPKKKIGTPADITNRASATDTNAATNDGPLATAPGPTADQLGELTILIVDSNGQPVKADGWLISESCNWKIGIIGGTLTSQMEPFSCLVSAIVDVGGQARVTDLLPIEVVAGKSTPATLTLLPAPSTDPQVVVAHPGLGLLKQENYAEIVQVVPGSSAAENQLQVGDLVLTIGGVAVAELTQEEILAALQGEADSALSLTVAIEQNGELVDGDVELRRTILIE